MFYVFLIRFLGFLFFFLEKIDKNTTLIVFIASSPFSELHNNNFLYLWWHPNLRAKKYTPSLFSQSVVGQCTAKVASMHTADRETPTQTLQFHVKFMPC